MKLPAYSSISLLTFMCCFLTAITGDVSINCGSAAVSAAHGGRKWVGDGNPKSSLLLKGKSTISNAVSISDHQIPYNTARISRSTFSYTFRLNPGFERWKDLFDVVAGPFTLLGNFSASLTGDALRLSYFIKEYCLNVEKNQLLSIIFSPATGESKDAYAFVNGIEIFPVTLGHSCFHGGGIGARVIGHESQLLHTDNGTALEMVHRQKFGWNSASSGDDIGDIFGIRETVSKKKPGDRWNILVDVGFRYLVRLRFSNRVLEMMENEPLVFKVLISEVVACMNVDILRERDHIVFLKHHHMDFIVLMRGRKEEGKRHLSLKSCDAFIDGHGPFTGFEIFKLSNFDNSLAIPNPLPCTRDSPFLIIQSLLSIVAHRNIITTVNIVIVLVTIIVHKLRGILESNKTQEENIPSARAKRFCRRFSLSEIRLGTKNFSDAHLIGRGGFGKVYKCLIDDGSESVAIKRLNLKSTQGELEFLTEIETLSQLRHVNVVSLIGYCNEHQEMILVYDYMPNGNLADHLYKLERKGTACSSLTWKQRLNICIGAARGLDYLHTGNAVIHRDVKVSNILLDENFTAKVSDFGLVKHEDRNNPQSHVSTKVKGTLGYIDPNYFRTGKLTRKSDVYAFGVVLLEVLCGRPVSDPSVSMDDRILTEWARKKISEGQVELIVASSLRGEILPDSLKTFVRVVEICLHDEPNERPRMDQVILQLNIALEQQETTIWSVPNEITSVAPRNDETKTVDSGQLPMSSTFGQTFTPPKAQSNHNMDNGYPSSGGNRRNVPAYKPSWGLWGSFFNRLKSPKNYELSVPGAKLTKFDMHTIAFATKKFSPMYKIGEGGFSSVYKAVLLSGQTAAVKRFKRFSRNCGFEDEILLLQNLRHPNIVKLLGYCIHGEERLLVYEFMENSSLYSLFFDEVRQTQLQWNQRFKIIVGIAEGLLYLHQDSGLRIIHRDPKPSNILLDSEMKPKISNFRLARSLGEDQSHVLTSVAGTYGYLSPESMIYGVFSTASDMYTFGVTVLQIVSGIKTIDQDGARIPLENIAQSLHNEEAIMDFVDRSIQDVNKNELHCCIEVGLLCTVEEWRERPTVSVVLAMLNGCSV